MPRSWLRACHQLFVTESAPIQQLEVKPGGVAQLDHGRRREGKHQGIADLRKGPRGPFRDGLHPQVRSIAEFPVLELDKYHAVGLSPS